MAVSARLSVLFALGACALALAMPLATSAQQVSCTLTASPPVVYTGQGTTLYLTSTNAIAATVDQSVGIMAPNGSKSVMSLAENTTYTATVSGSGTTTATCSTSVTTQSLPGSGSGGGGGASGMQQLQGLLQTAAGLMQLQGALGGNNSANAMCTPFLPECPRCGEKKVNGRCRQVGPSANMYDCPCSGTSNGVPISGICKGPIRCLGQKVGSGIGGPGGAGGGLGGGLQGLSSILQGLNSLTGGGAGGGGAAGGGVSSYPMGCTTQYYYVTTPSSDPCAIYQPGTSSQLGTGVIEPNLVSDILGALGGSTSSSTNTNTNVNNNQSGSQVSVTKNALGGEQVGNLSDSLTGDVKLGQAGATVYANVRKGLTEVAGFFGGNTFGGTSHSALARLCAARPWAGTGALASLTPDGFFDELCRRAGYEPGKPLSNNNGGGAAPAPTTTNTSFNADGAAPLPTTTTPYIAPEVDIRAEPRNVRLGTRTYVFWTSRGVSSCAVTGPNFTQNTLSGAGATVPITGPTTFTIVCVVTNSSSTISDTVTVDLAI
ncbi:MAG: hypothetical protein WA021_05945 [Minisyncoccia bacterium]